MRTFLARPVSRRRVYVLVAVVTGLAVCAAAVGVWALGFDDTSPRPSAAPGVTTSPPGVSGGSPPGASSGCAPAPSFPSPNCTGVPAGVSLKTVSGDLKLSKAGQVLENTRVTGDVIVGAPDVKIRNSEIHGSVKNNDGGTRHAYSITDTTVGPPSGCNSDPAVGDGDYTATRVHIRNTADGFRISWNNVLIEDSFVLLCSNPGDHSDGIQGYLGGANVTIRHSTIDQRPAVDNITAPIFISDDSKGINAVGNLFAGGGYTVRLHTGTSTFRDNRIVDGAWRYGPVASNCSTVDWANNWLVSVDGNYRVTSTKSELECT